MNSSKKKYLIKYHKEYKMQKYVTRDIFYA